MGAVELHSGATNWRDPNPCRELASEKTDHVADTGRPSSRSWPLHIGRVRPRCSRRSLRAAHRVQRSSSHTNAHVHRIHRRAQNCADASQRKHGLAQSIETGPDRRSRYQTRVFLKAAKVIWIPENQSVHDQMRHSPALNARRPNWSNLVRHAGYVDRHRSGPSVAVSPETSRGRC